MDSTEKNILIVDDEPDNLQFIFNTFLEAKLPYKISKAPNGEIALKIIQRNQPDVIITDWDMPQMSGIELIEKIKGLGIADEVPIIMCTGAMVSSEHLKTALGAGAIDYVRKPIDKIELLSRTQSALVLSDSRKKILEQNTELKKLNSTKDKFFSIIAHDLRTPIGAVMNLTEILKNDLNDFNEKELVEYVQLLHDTTQTGFRLLENLLEWARHQIGNRVYTPKVFSLKDVIESTLILLSVPANDKGLVVRNNATTDYTVFGDRSMIATVVRNLVSNAIKFTPSGGRVIITSQFVNDNVNVSVEDTGIGILETNIPKIFAIDRNFSTAGTNNEEGTGIGLSLCQEFIQEHGSEIHVQTEVGKGSIFSFTLPSGA